jgi:hypothetical protein
MTDLSVQERQIVEVAERKLGKLKEITVDRGASPHEADTAARMANDISVRIRVFLDGPPPKIDERYAEYRKKWFAWHGYTVT